MTRFAHRIRFFVCILLLSGCSSTYIQRSPGVPSSIEPSEVPGAIVAAEDALFADQSLVALDWMRAASELRGLPSDQLTRVQRLLEASAERFILSIEGDPRAAEMMGEIMDLELPRQITVSAAIQGAQLYMEREEYNEAVKLVQRLDKRHLTHHLRPEAGSLLLEAGLALSLLESGWFDSYREHAFVALEYCSVNYPRTAGGELALQRLAEMYEEDKRWSYAIARHEELTQNYPSSALVPASLARIPHLRLASIESPEYDRKALIEARVDLEKWLRDYAGHESTKEARYDLRDALVRLAESDLGIADFHVTIKNEIGARYHATRALAEARSAGDDNRSARAQAILDALGAPGDGGPLSTSEPEGGQS
ncbi:MAG: hypothetical protein ACI9F9_000322 [Candidatus Paceibacteria bacterium]|jgi:hypothetical protein